MRTWLRWLAVIFLAATIGSWVFQGANTKWTKTSVQVQKFDPVLEMEYVEWEKKFLPGVDFLVAGVLLAGILAGASRLARKKKRS